MSYRISIFFFEQKLVFWLNSNGISTDSTDSANSDALYTRGLDNPTPQMRLILEKEKQKEKVNIVNNNCVTYPTKLLRSKK